MSNLAIWDAVEKTDPRHTKAIVGKPYKGTSTNATHLAKRATELFGPCGIGWGVKVLNEGLLDGAPGEKIHRVHILFWYIHDEKRGEIEHFGQTAAPVRVKLRVVPQLRQKPRSLQTRPVQYLSRRYRILAVMASGRRRSRLRPAGGMMP